MRREAHVSSSMSRPTRPDRRQRGRQRRFGHQSPETITTVGTTVKDKAVDVGKRGPSVGDTFATTVDIKSQAGVDLGTERTRCTLGTGRWAICTGAFAITGRGEIVGTGMVNLGTESPDFDVPNTGGGRLRERRRRGARSPDENGETDTLELSPSSTRGGLAGPACHHGRRPSGCSATSGPSGAPGARAARRASHLASGGARPSMGRHPRSVMRVTRSQLRER